MLWISCHILIDHYDDVIMSTIASQITSLTIVYSTIYSGADQSKHQSSASLAFVWGIHRGPVNSPHKWPVTRKMFPFDDVIMWLPLHDDCTVLQPTIFHVIDSYMAPSLILPWIWNLFILVGLCQYRLILWVFCTIFYRVFRIVF